MSIFLLILKIIGIVLLSILGVIIALLLILLLVPLRYRIDGKREAESGEISLIFKASFLLHIFSFTYFKLDYTNARIRIFGIPIYDKRRKDKRAESKKNKENRNTAQTNEKKGKSILARRKKKDTLANDKINKETDVLKESVVDEPIDNAEPEYSIDWNEDTNEDEYKMTVSEEDEVIDKKNVDAEVTATDESREQDNEENGIDDDSGNKFSDKFVKICDKIKEWYGLFVGLINKSEKAIDDFANRVNKLSDKISSYYDFMNNYENRKAISGTLVQLKNLIKFVLPRKINGNVCFGMEDPASTGQVLMILGMFAPFLPNKLNINPDFENVCFYGNIKLKGHIALITIIIILLNKDVRRLYKIYKKSSSNNK